jgi:hypothetical protein
MDELYKYLILGRIIERLIIVFIGGGCIFGGYRLFYLKLNKKENAEFETKGWKIKLQNVSSGMIFVLLGIALLCYNVNNKLNTTFDTSLKDSARVEIKSPSTFSYLTEKNNISIDINFNIVKSINTIISIDSSRILGVKEDKNSFNNAKKSLILLKNRIIIKEFGEYNYKLFEELYDSYLINNFIEPKNREIIEKMESWYIKTY